MQGPVICRIDHFRGWALLPANRLSFVRICAESKFSPYGIACRSNERRAGNKTASRGPPAAALWICTISSDVGGRKVAALHTGTLRPDQNAPFPIIGSGLDSLQAL